MKKCIVSVLLILMLAGCSLLLGTDGQNGDAFICYSWVVGPIDFSTSDPAFAGLTYISNGTYRRATPGTYHFEYIAWDDSYWSGNYTIYIEEGTSAGFLFDGVDGDDLYFELACYSFGPDFYVWNESFAYLSLDNSYSKKRNIAVSTEIDLKKSTGTVMSVSTALRSDLLNSDPRFG